MLHGAVDIREGCQFEQWVSQRKTDNFSPKSNCISSNVPSSSNLHASQTRDYCVQQRAGAFEETKRKKKKSWTVVKKGAEQR